MARLAHPNVVAIKEATGSTDSATDILARCPGHSGEWLALTSEVIGAGEALAIKSIVLSPPRK